MRQILNRWGNSDFSRQTVRCGTGKDHPVADHGRARRVYKCSSTFSLILALNGGGWSTPSPARLTPEKVTRYSLYPRLGGPQSRSGLMRKISFPPGFDSPDRPALSESLYGLRYPGPRSVWSKLYNCHIFKVWTGRTGLNSPHWHGIVYSPPHSGRLSPGKPSARRRERDIRPGLKLHISLVLTLRMRGTSFHPDIHFRGVVLN